MVENWQLQINIIIIYNNNKRKPSGNQNLVMARVLCGRSWNQNGSGMSFMVRLCNGMRWEGQPIHQTTATPRPWQVQRVQKNLCAEEAKSKQLWQNIVKLCWVMIGWLPPFPICHWQRQQVHFSHLHDNIHIALTVAAQVLCRIQEWINMKGKISLFEKCFSFMPKDTGKGSEDTNTLTVLLASCNMFLKLVRIENSDDGYRCHFMPFKSSAL